METVNQVFISHSKRDVTIRQFFDSIFADTKVAVVRMEFEELHSTPSVDIRNHIMQSDALFVLLGQNLTFSQYTENWVGFEVGIATALNKPIWVMERFGDKVQFPIPYLTDFLLYEENNKEHRQFIRGIIEQFSLFPIVRNFGSSTTILCPYDDCKSTYFLHDDIDRFICPTCRREIILSDEMNKLPK